MPLADYEWDLDEILADIGETITFSGKDYTAVLNSPERRREHDIAGFLPDDDLAVLIKNDDYTTLPALGNTLVYKSRTYRIVRIQDTNEGVCKLLGCEEKTT